MKNKKILLVQPIYTLLIWGILLCCLIFFNFLPLLFNWDFAGFYSIIYCCLFVILTLITLAKFLYYLQFAIIDNDGIIIRGIFFKTAKVLWEDIYDISHEKIVTYDNRENVALSWLVIKLDESELIHGRAGKNGSKSPWCIFASKKNISVISQYIQIKEK